MTHQVWPLGAVPQHLVRPELFDLIEKGYEFNDPYDVVSIFEKEVAEFSGSKYAVAIDCATHGLELVLRYLKAEGTVKLPKHTYVSVPMMIQNLGCTVEFTDEQWTEMYQLGDYPVWDAAALWYENMYKGDFMVLSFQIKKPIPIGRGGMILTNNKEAADWLTKARHDGRTITTYYSHDEFSFSGWHYYMTPEDAARGILLMNYLRDHSFIVPTWKSYIDLSKKIIFNNNEI